MKTRDDFAIAAMHGLLAQDTDPNSGGWQYEKLAGMAYDIADVMIATRNGGSFIAAAEWCAMRLAKVEFLEGRVRVTTLAGCETGSTLEDAVQKLRAK